MPLDRHFCWPKNFVLLQDEPHKAKNCVQQVANQQPQVSEASTTLLPKAALQGAVSSIPQRAAFVDKEAAEREASALCRILDARADMQHVPGALAVIGSRLHDALLATNDLQQQRAAVTLLAVAAAFEAVDVRGLTAERRRAALHLRRTAAHWRPPLPA